MHEKAAKKYACRGFRNNNAVTLKMKNINKIGVGVWDWDTRPWVRWGAVGPCFVFIHDPWEYWDKDPSGNEWGIWRWGETGEV